MLDKRSEFSNALKCENDAEACPVRAEKNDIIQTSCQHSPILLSEGNVGPLGCLLHIGKRGLYAFSTLGKFFLLLESKENLVVHTNNEVSILWVSEMITIRKKKHSELVSKVQFCSISVHICLWKQVFLNDPLPRMHFFLSNLHLQTFPSQTTVQQFREAKKGTISILVFLSITDKNQFGRKLGVTWTLLLGVTMWYLPFVHCWTWLNWIDVCRQAMKELLPLNTGRKLW